MTGVCRCEDVTGGALFEAIADGAATLYGAKAWTRAGMGRCQGRICGWTLARLISSQAGYEAKSGPMRSIRAVKS